MSWFKTFYAFAISFSIMKVINRGFGKYFFNHPAEVSQSGKSRMIHGSRARPQNDPKNFPSSEKYVSQQKLSGSAVRPSPAKKSFDAPKTLGLSHKGAPEASQGAWATLPPRRILWSPAAAAEQPAHGKRKARISGRLLGTRNYSGGKSPKVLGHDESVACAWECRCMQRRRLRRGEGFSGRPAAARGERGGRRARRRARTHTERTPTQSQCTTSRSPGRSYAERCRRGDAYSHSSMERCHCFDCR